MLGGRCEVSWAPLRYCSPWWGRGLAPGGQCLCGVVAVGVGVVVVGVDAAPGSCFWKWMSALELHHAGSSPCSSPFPALKTCSVFLEWGEGLGLSGRGLMC